jgi:hypothetical protein
MSSSECFTISACAPLPDAIGDRECSGRVTEVDHSQTLRRVIRFIAPGAVLCSSLNLPEMRQRREFDVRSSFRRNPDRKTGVKEAGQEKRSELSFPRRHEAI